MSGEVLTFNPDAVTVSPSGEMQAREPAQVESCDMGGAELLALYEACTTDGTYSPEGGAPISHETEALRETLSQLVSRNEELSRENGALRRRLTALAALAATPLEAGP